MRDITSHVLRRMSSKSLLALLQFDSWQTIPENKLSRDTIQRIHDIAAEREDGDSQALLRSLATIQEQTSTGAPTPDRENNTVTKAASGNTPTHPPEATNWEIEHASPDILALAAQTFDEAEFLAAMREVERTGGVQMKDLIDEIEEKLKGGD